MSCEEELYCICQHVDVSTPSIYKSKVLCLTATPHRTSLAGNQQCILCAGFGPCTHTCRGTSTPENQPTDKYYFLISLYFSISFLLTMESIDFAVKYDDLIDLIVEGFEDIFGDEEL